MSTDAARVEDDVDGDQIEHEVAALRDLMASPGWKILERFAEAQYGLAAIGARLLRVEGETPATLVRAEEVSMAAARLHGAHTAVEQILQHPAQRIQQLTTTARPKRRFDNLRRTPR